MFNLLQQIASGVAMGGIYACLGLALVMIYQSTNHINFAQGEMAMFSTFIAYLCLKAGLPYGAAFVLTVAFGFAMGFVIERVVLRPLKNAPVSRSFASGCSIQSIVKSRDGIDIPATCVSLTWNPGAISTRAPCPRLLQNSKRPSTPGLADESVA